VTEGVGVLLVAGYRREMNKQEEENVDKMIDYYANDCVAFSKDQLCFGHPDSKFKIDHQQVKLWETYQEVILAKQKASRIADGAKEEQSDKDKKYAKLLGIVVRSCKGPGKSAGVAAIIIHFMCFYGRDQLNMTTAPKFDQIVDILFRSIQGLIDESFRILGKASIPWNFLGKQRDRIYKKVGIEKDKWSSTCVMLARTSKASNGNVNADALQGYHSPYQLIVIEEGWGVPRIVYQALTTTLTKEVNLAIIIGNPTNNDSYPNDAWVSEYWLPIQFNLDSSNIITQESKDRIKNEYKNYPNLYRVFVDGLPPLEDNDTIMRFSRICECFNLELQPETYNKEPKILTFDPGMGGDNSVIGVRQGMKWLEFAERKCVDTDINIDFCKEFITIYNPDRIGVDAIGIGKGVYDGLVKDYGEKVRKVNFNDGQTFKEENFKNKRAELFMKLANSVNAVAMSFPENMRLKGELNAIKLISDKVPLQIISKPDLRKELGRSTGLADVCAMSMDFDDIVIKQNIVDTAERYHEAIEDGRSFLSA
jgi:hypothetical protein